MLCQHLNLHLRTCAFAWVIHHFFLVFLVFWVEFDSHWSQCGSACAPPHRFPAHNFSHSASFISCLVSFCPAKRFFFSSIPPLHLIATQQNSTEVLLPHHRARPPLAKEADVAAVLTLTLMCKSFALKSPSSVSLHVVVLNVWLFCIDLFFLPNTFLMLQLHSAWPKGNMWHLHMQER